jgi:hypothetical protein
MATDAIPVKPEDPPTVIQTRESMDVDFAKAFAEAADDTPIVKLEPEPAAPVVPPVVPAAAVVPPVVPAKEPVKAPPSAVVDSGLPDPEVVAAAAAAEAAKVAARAAPEVPAAPPPAALTPEQKAAQDADMLARFQQVVKEAVKPEPVKVPEQPVEQIAPYSAEEQAFLTKYEAEWADVSHAETLKRSREYQQMVNYIFAQIGPVLRDLRSQTGSVAERQHAEQVYNLVEDYDEIHDKVIKWVGEQPDYIKAAYENVAKSGSPAQVNDLIGRWRVATNTPAPTAAAALAPTPEATAAAAAAAVEAKKVAAAAAALAPVGSKRSGVTTDGIDPNNFESAFSKFSEDARLEQEKEDIRMAGARR